MPEMRQKEFLKEEDILDVWFDSGVSFATVVEKRDNLNYPADLYLEGSDQHRGGFSLLSCRASGQGGRLRIRRSLRTALLLTQAAER